MNLDTTALLMRRQSPWTWMLAVNMALMATLVSYKYVVDYPIIQYSFLLADYHFGFMKRALLGSVLSLFQDKIYLREVFWIALATWLATIALFFVLFRRTFGFSSDRLALLVFTFGSPFFFKNFFQTHGFFDIYGCLFAIVILLLPVNRLFPLVFGAGSAVLVLIHHLHFLLYLPTIAVIAIVRFFLMRDFSRADVAYAGASALLPCAAFIASIAYGNAPVPPDVLLAYMHMHAADPLPVVNITIWYTSATEELTKTADMFAINGPRLPVFFALIALHWPVIRFMRALMGALPNSLHRRLAIIGIVGVIASYVIIFVFVFDYARWFSSWAVCMILIMHALAMLLVHGGKTLPAFLPQTKKCDEILGWVLTVIPRVGLTIPF